MAKNGEKHLNAKQRAYQEKEAQKGDKIVKLIMAGLILLAVFYVIWLIATMGV